MTGVSVKSTKKSARSPIDVGLLLCVPFACSIGGTGTLTGTDLNLYLQGFHQDQYREYNNGNETWVNDAAGKSRECHTKLICTCRWIYGHNLHQLGSVCSFAFVLDSTFGIRLDAGLLRWLQSGKVVWLFY